jgi:hypothetical protein
MMLGRRSVWKRRPGSGTGGMAIARVAHRLDAAGLTTLLPRGPAAGGFLRVGGSGYGQGLSVGRHQANHPAIWTGPV